MISFSEFLLLAEAKRPISREARSQIADIAGNLGSGRYAHDPRREAKAKKLVSSLQSYDPKREKRELPVGRMAAKVSSLIKRPRRSGADKESDFARADEIEAAMRD